MIKVSLNKVMSNGHNNLKLELVPINFIQISDSYYFAIDNYFMENNETQEKVILNLKGLLKGWVNKISNLEKSNTIYLPFDFSDQYIGCLRVRGLTDSEIIVDYGDTRKFNGFNLYPSQFAKFKLIDDEYESDTKPFKASKSVVIESINSSILNL